MSHIERAHGPIRFEFPPPARVWSTNDERTLHHMQRHELVGEWKAAARMYWIAHRNKNRMLPVRLMPSVVQLEIPFAQRRKRDPHNYCGTVVKAVIDGLVLADAWPDDTAQHVGHRESKLYIGKLVVVHITPMTEGWNRSGSESE